MYLKQIMSNYGEIENLNLVIKGPSQFAYIKYKRVREASRAFANLREIMGHLK
jgi:hypothetical protein